jgi:predicted lipoprotein with Yx(FWY)xxD motif
MARIYRYLGSGLVALFLVLSVSTALAQSVIVKSVANATLGNILTDSRGMTLYIYTKDTANVSNCYDKCADAWPPLTVPTGQTATAEGIGGTLGTIVRTDGTSQVTYNSQPLYYWVKDQKPGDTTGQNVGTVWFVVKADAAAGAAPATAGNAPATLPTTGANSGPQAELFLLALSALVLGGGITWVGARRSRAS